MEKCSPKYLFYLKLDNLIGNNKISLNDHISVA